MLSIAILDQIERDLPAADLFLLKKQYFPLAEKLIELIEMQVTDPCIEALSKLWQ